jgi:hypothetical protein
MLSIELDKKKANKIKIKKNKSMHIHYIQTTHGLLKEHLIIYFSQKIVDFHCNHC